MRRPRPLRPEQLHVAIIGAGATGVELAAELHRTTRDVVAYGLDRVDPEKDIQAQPDRGRRPRPAGAAGAPVEAATEAAARSSASSVHTCRRGGRGAADGRASWPTADVIPAELVVWAAGVKAPDFLKDIAGLETNRINQLVVLPTLQTTRDDDIFAIGDCAACPWLGEARTALVPPRAQAAHQQASHVAKQIRRRLAGKPLADAATATSARWCRWASTRTVGNMMGGLIGGSLMDRGRISRG